MTAAADIRTMPTADERRVAAQICAARSLPAAIEAYATAAPEYFTYGWNVSDRIEGCVKPPQGETADDVRTGMRTLAARMGMDYAEQPHGRNGRVKITVSGRIDGVLVELWDLTPEAAR